MTLRGRSIRHEAVMGTIVTIEVLRQDAGGAIGRAFEWFREIERRCTRFDPDSELMRLVREVGVAVEVSEILFEAIQFAVEVARETDGAFDPTVGAAMETRGFDRNYLTGQVVHTAAQSANDVTYRDLQLNATRKTVTLRRPLVIDLGAVAKGLAVDAAARELKPLEDFAIDAGGDLYLGGCNAEGEPWSVGIRHPRRPTDVVERVRVSDAAVCTSGDYERRSRSEEHGHIIDPRGKDDVRRVASATVIAPTAMLADALATASFVLGPIEGVGLLERLGIAGLLLSDSLERHATERWACA